MLKSYLKQITDTGIRGDAREESYYPALADLFTAYAESTDKKSIHITTLPKKTEAGNPDFRVWDGKQHIVGYIEASQKKISHRSLPYQAYTNQITAQGGQLCLLCRLYK